MMYISAKCDFTLSITGSFLVNSQNCCLRIITSCGLQQHTDGKRSIPRAESAQITARFTSRVLCKTTVDVVPVRLGEIGCFAEILFKTFFPILRRTFLLSDLWQIKPGPHLGGNVTPLLFSIYWQKHDTRTRSSFRPSNKLASSLMLHENLLSIMHSRMRQTCLASFTLCFGSPKIADTRAAESRSEAARRTDVRTFMRNLSDSS